MYLDGYTLLNIADTLMAQGRRTATGKIFGVKARFSVF